MPPLLPLLLLLPSPAQGADRTQELERRVETQAKELEAQRRMIEELRAALAARGIPLSPESAPAGPVAGEIRKFEEALGQGPSPDSGRPGAAGSGLSLGGSVPLRY